MKSSDMFNHTLLPFPIAFAFCLQYRMIGCLHLSGWIPYKAPKRNLAVYNLGLRCEVGGSGSNSAKLLPIIADCRCSGHTTLKWGFTTHYSYGYLFPLAFITHSNLSFVNMDIELSSSEEDETARFQGYADWRKSNSLRVEHFRRHCWAKMLT